MTGEDPSTSTLPENTHFCTTIETDQNRWAVFTQVPNHLSKGSFWDAPVKSRNISPCSAKIKPSTEICRRWWSTAGVFSPCAFRAASRASEIPSSSSLDSPLLLATPHIPICRWFSAIPARTPSRPSPQQQSPVSQWAVLVELVATLRREGIRYVGIVATDPLDALFLSRAIRALAPNIRIVLFSADLLFARASDPWDLSGTLAVTSYPLISRNQYYSRAVRPRRAQFANDAAEGDYNACRRMLLLAPETNATSPCSAERPGSNRQGLSSRLRATFRPAESQHKPAVWLTILGRNEWWPVAAALRSDIESRLLEGPAPASHSTEQFSVETSPRPWFLFFWIIWSACALHVVIFFGMNIRPGAASGPGWENKLLRRLAMGYQRDLATRRRATLAAASLTVAFACCSLIVAIWASGLQGWGYLSGDEAPVTTACIRDNHRRIRHHRSAVGRLGHRATCPQTLVARVAVAAVAAAEIAGTAYALFSASIAHVREFAGYRAIHIESGASPLLPVILLLLPIYLFCWWRLSRLRTDEERHASAPAGEDDEPFPASPSPKACKSSAPVRWYWSQGSPRMADFFQPPQVAGLYRGRLLRCGSLWPLDRCLRHVCADLIRFFVAWRKLRKMLQRLERHPLRYAFTRCRGTLAGPPSGRAIPAPCPHADPLSSMPCDDCPALKCRLWQTRST